VARRVLVAGAKPPRYERQGHGREALGPPRRRVDPHGEIIIKEAFDESRTTFDYDTQDYAYQEVQRLLDSAIVLLRHIDGAVDATYLAKGDHIYNGNRVQWLRFAWGMKALVLNHFTNKVGTYQSDSVIAAVDSSFKSNADDALLQYPGTSTDLQDYNFYGWSRNNIRSYRQTQFVVGLMNGTQFGGVVDPRMSRMLAPASDGQYRGVDPNLGGFGALTAAQQPFNFFGYAGTGGSGLPARYIFADRSKLPVMTYAELQFIKAEAALRKGDQATARTAYVNGISASIDFVNARNLDAGQTPTQITGTEKTAFLADTNIVPALGNLTRSHVMSQKFIALWGWGHNEIWMDMRRYHYEDRGPPTSTPTTRASWCSGSGRGTTRSTSGTRRDSPPSTPWIAIITRIRCGLPNGDALHETTPRSRGAALCRPARLLRQEHGPGAPARARSHGPHHVLQFWRERARGEFLRQRHEDDGDPVEERH